MTITAMINILILTGYMFAGFALLVGMELFFTKTKVGKKVLDIIAYLIYYK